MEENQYQSGRKTFISVKRDTSRSVNNFGLVIVVENMQIGINEGERGASQIRVTLPLSDWVQGLIVNSLLCLTGILT